MTEFLLVDYNQESDWHNNVTIRKYTDNDNVLYFRVLVFLVTSSQATIKITFRNSTRIKLKPVNSLMSLHVNSAITIVRS
jgi:hypothetical protein